MPEVVVFLAAGRSDEQKKGLMKDISDAVVKNTNVPIAAVTVSIMETPLVNKMKGGETFAERAQKK
jgi:4-oxalocrotonate tautomerase